LLGVIIPLLFFGALLVNLYWVALALLALTGLDMLDGMVARSSGKVTPFGGFLDSTIDRFADFVILVAFGFANLIAWEVVLPLVLLTYLISYMRSRIELAAKGTLAANVGIIERGERIAIIFFGLLLYVLFPSVSVRDKNILTITFLLLTGLSIVTALQRLTFAYKKL
jgi:archaetidylinositol phosphate synthase